MMSETICDEPTIPSEQPAATNAQMTAGEWLLLFILAAVQFTHIVDFMIIMPLGPVYIANMNLSSEQFGYVVSAYTFSAGFAGLLAARFLDRFDRKSALLTLYAGFAAGTFLCAFAPNYPLLLAARTVAGAFGGVAAAVVLAIVGDVFPGSRRGFAMGVLMTAFSVASIVGVPLGLELAELYNWHYPFAVLGFLSLAVLGLATLVLPPLRGHMTDGPPRPVKTWAVLTDPNHLRAFALMVALVLSTAMLIPFLPTYLVANVGFPQGSLLYMYLWGGIVTLVALPVVGRLADRFGKLIVFRILVVATLVSIAVVTNLPAGLSVPAVLALTTAFMVTTAGRMVPAMALITASAAPRERGSFMSLNATVQHIALASAAAISGLLLPLDENKALVGFPFVGLLACIATAVSMVLAGRLRPAPGGELAPDSAIVTEEVPETGGLCGAASTVGE
jgi:MFS transporter, DHA1 family, inner membrane transport protein